MQRHAETLGCKTAEQATKDLTFLCYTHSRVTSCSQTLRTGLCKPLPKISLYLISSWPAVKAETPSRGPLPSDLFLFLLPLSILLKRDSSSLPLSISISAKASLSSICTLYVHSLFFLPSLLCPIRWLSSHSKAKQVEAGRKFPSSCLLFTHTEGSASTAEPEQTGLQWKHCHVCCWTSGNAQGRGYNPHPRGSFWNSTLSQYTGLGKASQKRTGREVLLRFTTWE